MRTRASSFGPTAVIGLEAMRDVEVLRTAYGLGHVDAIPALRAIEVKVDDLHVRTLLANAAFDPRIRYISPAGRPRRSAGMTNDPLVATTDGSTGRPSSGSSRPRGSTARSACRPAIRPSSSA
jgi:hypothetical protein